jgi:hypothetical protein
MHPYDAILAHQATALYIHGLWPVHAPWPKTTIDGPRATAPTMRPSPSSLSDGAVPMNYAHSASHHTPTTCKNAWSTVQIKNMMEAQCGRSKAQWPVAATACSHQCQMQSPRVTFRLPPVGRLYWWQGHCAGRPNCRGCLDYRDLLDVCRGRRRRCSLAGLVRSGHLFWLRWRVIDYRWRYQLEAHAAIVPRDYWIRLRRRERFGRPDRHVCYACLFKVGTSVIRGNNNI